MAKKKSIQGSMVALVTPFRGGRIDEQALKGLIDFHLKNKTDAIIPCGTTGESATMTHEEHKYMMAFTVDYVAGRVPVICGAGSNNTAEALPLVKYARNIGADGVLAVTPYYNKPTQEGLFKHYQKLAGAAEIPLILYNVPGRTGVNMLPSTVARLSKISNVAAVKEASGSLAAVDEILELCDITVLSGDDGLTMPMLAIGAKGVISVTANVVPRLMRDMVHAVLDSDLKKAQRLHSKMTELARVMFIETNPIPVKVALSMMGMIKNEFRLPLCDMDAKKKSVLRKALKRLEVL